MSDGIQASATEAGGPRDRRAPSSLGARQLLTVLLLFGGYSACYFCRADLAVASPLLIEELGRRGVSHADALIHIGQIASLGVFAYAIGKLFLTGLGDFWGGRPNFLIGLGGATIFTLLFTVGGALPVFTIAWLGNRLTQSIAWAGMLKVSSRWFDFTSHGTVIGVLSISYLVGDAVARQWMGALIGLGYGWRAMFYLAAAVAGFFLVANYSVVAGIACRARLSRGRRNPQNCLRRRLVEARRISRRWCCRCSGVALSSWSACCRSAAPSCARPSTTGSPSTCATSSATAWAARPVPARFSRRSERYRSSSPAGSATGSAPNSRPVVMAVGLTATAAALALLGVLRPSGGSPLLPLVAIGTTALCLLGPYSYLGGALACDFGGKQGTAQSSGIIDGVGYLGSVIGGVTVARASVAFGWGGVFLALAVISLVAAAGAVYLHRLTVLCAARSGVRAAMTPVAVSAAVRPGQDALLVQWQDGTQVEYASVWLRDNLPEDRDSFSGQRLIDVADLPADPRIQAASVLNGRVQITWAGESLVSSFAPEWLYAHSRAQAAASAPAARQWLEGARLDARRDFAWEPLRSIAVDPHARLTWLTRLLADGIAFLSEVPCVESGIIDSDGARSAVSPKPTMAWYSTSKRYHSRRISLIPIWVWGCTRTTPTASRYPDFRRCTRCSPRPMAATACLPTASRWPQQLQRLDAGAFAALTRTAVPFRYRSADCRSGRGAGSDSARLFRGGSSGALQQPLDCAADAAGGGLPDVLPRLPAASRTCCDEPQFQLATRLGDGELVVFDNQRVLHGRTGFASARHPRHLRGCYLSRDSVYSQQALLQRQLAAGEAS